MMHPVRLFLGYRRRREAGVTLLIALVAVVALTLAALVLVRSTGTSQLIAGNLAFQQAATQAADAGVELAFQTLSGMTDPETSVANQYFAVRQNDDANGAPSTVVWTNLPCYDPSNLSGAPVSCNDDSRYRVRYIIDRQCWGALPIANKNLNCMIDNPNRDYSRAVGRLKFDPDPRVVYRVTVQSLGPRGTTRFIQAAIVKQ